MSALFTALVEGESKESLAEMVCELRGQRAELVEKLHDMAIAVLSDSMDGGLSESHRRKLSDAIRDIIAPCEGGKVMSEPKIITEHWPKPMPIGGRLA